MRIGSGAAPIAQASAVRRNVEASSSPVGDIVNGIHEVTGSIPVSSTNFGNKLARQRIGEAADLSISCPSGMETP